MYRVLYQRFISSMLAALASAKSLDVLSFTFSLLGYHDRLTPQLRSDIARLLAYDGMHEQLRSLPDSARLYVSVEDAEPLGPKTSENWLRLFVNRLPEWRGRLYVRLRGEPS